MDLSQSIANMSMEMSNARLAQGIQTSVMRKAMDAQTSGAAALINSFNQTASRAQAFAGDNGFLFDAQA